MYLYFILYYFLTVLYSTSSYVLLAANIEDFRTLAKQFVPDSMADEILEMAKDSIRHDSSRKPNMQPTIRDVESTTDSMPEYYDAEVTVRSHIKEKTMNESLSDTTTEPSTPQELSLDELVEKVKERLQEELTLMAATADRIMTTEEPFTKPIIRNNKPDNSPELEDASHSSEYKNQVRHVQQSRDNVEEKSVKKVKNYTPDKRYVADMFVAQPPKYMLDQGKPVDLALNDALEVKKYKTPTIQERFEHTERNKNKFQHEIITTPSGPFAGIDITVNKEDSKGDDVTPKKGEDSLEQETETPSYKNVPTKPNIFDKESLSEINKKVLELFSDESETTTKGKDYINYEDETTNYNKRKRKAQNIRQEKETKNNNNNFFKQRQRVDNREFGNVPHVIPLSAGNAEKEIQPLGRQKERYEVKKKGYVDDNDHSEELKAKLERLSFKKYTVEENVAPDDETYEEEDKKKKNKKRMNIVPKRDGYKMSSPNYMVELPIEYDKYKPDKSDPDENENSQKIDDLENTTSGFEGRMVLM